VSTDTRPIAILIAESDELIRMVTADMLVDLGFRAIEVRTAVEAVAVLEGPSNIHTLITARRIMGDGIALVHLVHARWPSVRIILTSGRAVDHSHELPPGVRLLRKPYDSADLARELGTAVDQNEADVSSAPLMPSGIPPHTGADLGTGMGAVAAPAAEPDKT
jgi:two-component system, response regulator PdtaR